MRFRTGVGIGAVTATLWSGMMYDMVATYSDASCVEAERIVQRYEASRTRIDHLPHTLSRVGQYRGALLTLAQCTHQPHAMSLSQSLANGP